MSVSRVPAVAPVPAENIAALNIDLEQIKANLDSDFDLIKQSTEWQSAKSKRDEAWTFKEANDKSGVSWIRVRGELKEIPLESVADLLDTHLEARQAEWHELYLGGSVLAQINEKDPHVELAYFRYKSPMRFVSPRETLYSKARRETRDEQGRLTSLLLSYRSVDEAAQVIAKDSKCERITLKSAHLIERVVVDNVESTVYWCVQWSNPGGMLSKFAGLATDGQLNIMIQEIEGIRNACKKSSTESTETEATETVKPESKSENVAEQKTVAAAAVVAATSEPVVEEESEQPAQTEEPAQPVEQQAEKVEEPVAEPEQPKPTEESAQTTPEVKAAVVTPEPAPVTEPEQVEETAQSSEPEQPQQPEEPAASEEPVVEAQSTEAPAEVAESQPTTEAVVTPEPAPVAEPEQAEETAQSSEPEQSQQPEETAASEEPAVEAQSTEAPAEVAESQPTTAAEEQESAATVESETSQTVDETQA